MPGPISDWTPARAAESWAEADEPRSTLASASWKTLVMSSRPTTSPSSLQTGCNRRHQVSVSPPLQRQPHRPESKQTYQVSETSRDHELQRLGRARRVPSDHRVLGHDGRDWRRSRVEAFGGDLQRNTPWQIESGPVGGRSSGRARVCTRTRKARSLAVKIPLRPSSSSTTSTQSLRLAAQS